jgi:hypothetical protein
VRPSGWRKVDAVLDAGDLAPVGQPVAAEGGVVQAVMGVGAHQVQRGGLRRGRAPTGEVAEHGDGGVETLREGRIRRAAIDVFDTEPLPADHPLRSLPNALLTGHVGYVTRELYKTFYQDAVEDIAAFRTGTPIRLMG